LPTCHEWGKLVRQSIKGVTIEITVTSANEKVLDSEDIEMDIKLTPSDGSSDKYHIVQCLLEHPSKHDAGAKFTDLKNVLNSKLLMQGDICDAHKQSTASDADSHAPHVEKKIGKGMKGSLDHRESVKSEESALFWPFTDDDPETSCKFKCGTEVLWTNGTTSCWCDASCKYYNDCCWDIAWYCPGDYWATTATTTTTASTTTSYWEPKSCAEMFNDDYDWSRGFGATGENDDKNGGYCLCALDCEYLGDCCWDYSSAGCPEFWNQNDFGDLYKNGPKNR